MSSKTNSKRHILFFFSLIWIIIFYIWSKLILISLGLIFVADWFTISFFSNLIKNRLKPKLFTFFKYSLYSVLTISLALFIRTFFLDVYFVPSSSMERTLFPNDYILVDKVSYGTKIPKRLQDVPIVGSFYKNNGILSEFNLYKPLRGFKNYKRKDIVVFKSIEENDVFLVKRIIGMPGERIKITHAETFINDTILKDKKEYSYNYIIKKGYNKTKNYSNEEIELLEDKDRSTLTKDVITNRGYTFPMIIFPQSISKKEKWTRDNYGELTIPKKGMKITLDKRNFEIYGDIILNFEKTRIKFSEEKTITYTFKNNYYFMLGDNRHNSIDSRSFGFVPESFIQGKMIKVFPEKGLFN